MKTRVITGAILAGVMIPVVVIGGVLFQALMLLLTLGATYEMFRLYNTKEQLPLYVGGIYILCSGSFFYIVMQYFNGNILVEWVLLGLMMLLIIAGLMLVFMDEFNSERFGQMLGAVLYPAVGFSTLYGLRSIDLLSIGYLFLITISTDIFAYIVGINFGKHRLAIKISPKKSIEGSIGGTLSAAILTMVYIYAFNLDTVANIPVTFGWMLLLIVLISIMGQIGDLVASKLKRHMGIKDFSQIFPGHGGILDRFDSAIFAGMVLVLISQVVTLL
jgi:phosphatidate cytidylyltransferase